MNILQKNLSQRGSVTLYLSICFSLMMTLIVYTIESCHLDALVARSESITYISLDSLFGEYCLPLFEKYGLFCLNEQGLDIDSLLEEYANENCSIPFSLLTGNDSFLKLSLDSSDVTDITYITDNNGEVLVEQVCDYVKYLEVSALASQLQEDASTEYPSVYPVDENGELNMSIDAIDVTSLMSYAPDSSKNDGKTSINTDDIDADSFEDKISTSIGHIIKNGLLSFVVENPEEVSSKSVDKAVLPSVTCQLDEEGIAAQHGYYKDISDATYKKACFCEYIANTFNCYTDHTTDSPLDYSMEYIVYGSPDDDVNLINCCLQLITLRTGLNLIHLVSDTDKFNAALDIAKKAGAIPIPGAPVVAQLVILSIWATAEAILDVRDLLSGKSVVLFKTDKEWNLSLQGLANFSKATSSHNGGDSGLSYKRYLEMLIAVQNNISVYYRTMDLIQLNICNEYSADFRLSKCIAGIEAELTYTLPFLILSNSTNYKSKGKFSYR